MDADQFTIGLKKFKQALSEVDLNLLGKELGFAKKLRKVTPFRLVACLLASFSNTLKTISDIHRTFNELKGSPVQYKPFHKQLAKKAFPTFMRHVVSHLLNKLVDKTLQLNADNPFSKFTPIYIHDGTAYGVKATLKQSFPGKFEQAVAAVQLHTTLSLLEDEATAVTLSPFIEAENNYLPETKSLQNSLLLADRCYLNIPYFYAIEQNKGFFIVRGKQHMNPLIKEVYVEGKMIKKWVGKKLKAVRIPKNNCVDLTAEWKFLGGKMQARLLIKWNPSTKEYMYLVTNLSRAEFDVEKILLAYNLRWQVELLFKEWKSYANLRKFDTSNVYIAEGLIWAALGAAIMKRFVAHLAQFINKVVISTQIVAKCVGRKILLLLEKLICRDYVSFQKYLQETINYLGSNAKRTNLTRENKTGRGQLGLVAIGVLKG